MLRRACCIVLALCGSVVQGQVPNATSPLGMNLAPPWASSDVPLVNLVHSNAGFFNPTWSGFYEPVDEQGYPLSVSADEADRAYLPLIGDIAHHYPAGDYVLLYEGDGEIRFEGSGITLGPVTLLPDGVTHRQVVSFDPTQSEGLLLVIERSNAANPLRQIRFLLPGHEDTYQEQPFNPAFLSAWEKYKVLRFTHIQAVWDFETEGETHVTDVNWSDRMQMEDFRYGQRWPYELIIALGNTLQADLWIHIPHTATREYTQAMAALFAEGLNPNSKLLVEYSNECWNGISTTYTYAERRGVEQGLFDPIEPANPYFAALNYCAVQAVDHTNLFEEHFDRLGRADQVVRVFGAFIGNLWLYARDEDGDGLADAGALFEQRTRFNRPAYQDVDALAITSYFGGELGLEANIPWVENWSLDQAFDYLATGILPAVPPTGNPTEPSDFEEGGLPGTLALIQGYHNVSQQLGLSLVTYEGGPHLVALVDNERVNQLFVDLLRDPRMGELVTAMLDGTRAAGVDLQVLFNSSERLAPENAWARFGFLEHVYQDRDSAYRWLAADRWIDENPAWWQTLQVNSPPLEIPAVDALYRGLLGRLPNAAERAAWAQAQDHAALILQLLQSAEFIDGVEPVARLYWAAFDRLPDAAGLQYWVEWLRASGDRLTLAAAFAESPEMQRRLDGATAGEAFIQALYSNVLNRPADALGLQFWSDVLATGQSRGFMLEQFAQSPENRQRTARLLPVVLLYQALLQRAPTPEELAAGAELALTELVAQLLAMSSP